jgi:hypothetical protein
MTRFRGASGIGWIATVALVVGSGVRALPGQPAASDTAGVRAGMRELVLGCQRDAGRTWGQSLCGPVVAVDARTRTAIANMAPTSGGFTPDHGVFVGVLPDGVGMANTSVDWSGTRWAMVLLPLPSDPFARADLLAHESFHRIQPALHLTAPDAINGHLDQRDARVWLRLELHALAYALCSSGETARRHARAALLFRAARRRQYPGADTLENSLELQEGLAEYTGTVFALAAEPMGPLRVVRAMDEIEHRPTYVRSFAYATGPAWGLLLDRYAPGWRRRIARDRDLTAIARSAVRVSGPLPADDALRAIAEPYGYAIVMEEETVRAAARDTALAEYRWRLVSGPTLRIRQTELMRGFNPNTLVPLDSLGTVYPTGSFSAKWGRLEVTGGGALVSPDFTMVRVVAPADASGPVVHGDGWTLTLEAGYRVVPGERPGDFAVAGPGGG